MRLPLATLVAAACLVTGTATARDDAIELVPVESLTFAGSLVTPWLPDRADGQPATIHGVLRLPPGSDRVPAVLLLHGCTGITDAETEWGRWLRERDIATFIVNSFTGRGIASTCRGTQAFHVASALTDVFRSLDVLLQHPRIDATRIAVMGHSVGGRTALWSAHARLRERYGGHDARFAAHVAVYPASCHIRLVDAPEASGGPIRILHGTEDDWMPVAACREHVARLQRDGIDAALLEYAGGRHGFDNPGLPAHAHIVGIVNSAGCSFAEQGSAIVDSAGRTASDESPCVRRAGTVGHDPVLQQKAREDLLAFLDRVFALRQRGSAPR